jgi:hypothetical protein
MSEKCKWSFLVPPQSCWHRSTPSISVFFSFLRIPFHKPQVHRRAHKYKTYVYINKCVYMYFWERQRQTLSNSQFEMSMRWNDILHFLSAFQNLKMYILINLSISLYHYNFQNALGVSISLSWPILSFFLHSKFIWNHSSCLFMPTTVHWMCPLKDQVL